MVPKLSPLLCSIRSSSGGGDGQRSKGLGWDVPWSPFRLKDLFPQLLGVLWAGGPLLSAVSEIVQLKVQPASNNWSIPGYKGLTVSTQAEASQKGYSSGRAPGGGGVGGELRLSQLHLSISSILAFLLSLPQMLTSRAPLNQRNHPHLPLRAPSGEPNLQQLRPVVTQESRH